MRRFILVSVLLMALAVSSPSRADTNSANRHVPDSREVGSGRLSYLLWNVFDAVLYAPNGVWDAGKPYALSLSYLRKLDGDAIAKYSMEEMRKQGFKDEVKLALWYQKMTDLFPDVDENTTLTGVRDQNGNAVFYRNGERMGAINDPEFSRRFFGIWLSEDTSEPDLRKRLLGMAK